MLLAQPFEDPFKEHQKRKMPFLARCRFISARTKRALQNLKDRVHYASRDYQTVMVPDHRCYMITPLLPPPPQPWPYSGAACYMSPIMLPPPPPLPPFPPMHPSFGGLLPLHHALPYSVCVHFNSSPCSHSIPKQQQNNRSCQGQGQDHSLTTESTLYSPSSSSILDDDEKEQIEEKENDAKNDHHQRLEDMDTIHPQLTRSHSDEVSNRRQQRRPSINDRWNSNDGGVYYS